MCLPVQMKIVDIKLLKIEYKMHRLSYIGYVSFAKASFDLLFIYL